MKIYTRSGDQGQTSLFGGQRVSKANLRVEAYGTVDELNAHIGYAGALIEDSDVEALLARVQGRLFDIGADLATPQSSDTEKPSTHVQRVREAWSDEVEAAIDRIQSELAPLNTFILPGGVPAGAALHVARTVCRRAERRVVALGEEEDVNPALVVYLNRLADLLFVLARLVNQRAGIEDAPWKSAGAGEAL